MLENLKLLTVKGELGLVLFVENLGGVSRVFELDVSETSASTILEAFDLGRSGGTILAEEVEEFFLSDFNGEVANEKIGLSVELLTSRFLNRYSEVLSLQFEVVHFFASGLSTFLRREGNKSVVKGLLLNFVNANSGSNGVQSLGLEQLLKL